MLIYSVTYNLRYLKRDYPGWAKLMDALTENRLKAADLKEVLGLTYRQINDWDSRGILQGYRSGGNKQEGSGWRKFSISELIPLSILVEMKKQGVPVTKLLKVTETLFLDDIVFYEFFPNIVYGIDTYFYTDLESFTGYDCIDPNKKTLEFYIESLNRGSVLMVLPLKSIVENIFSKLKLPDFNARMNSEGKFDFTINGVPLALEPLSKNPTPEEIAKFYPDILAKSKGE